MRNNNICSAAIPFECALHKAEPKTFDHIERKKTLTGKLVSLIGTGSFLLAFFLLNTFSFRAVKSVLIALGLGFASLVNASTIALIIDDIGNKPEDIRAFSLPSEITFAILPHTPYSMPFSQLAEQQQREVMLHVPMESLSGKELGPGALTSIMPPEMIKEQLEQAHASVPNAIAINNHMGSKLTQLTLPMTATMEYLQTKGLYFVDSRTTRFSRAENIAQKYGVPSLHRHVFLDHIPEPRHIETQFKRLRGIANRDGLAIGIAHPYPQTLAYLSKHLPELEKAGIRLVPLSELMFDKQQQLAMNKAEEKESPVVAEDE
ncbi:divergent polysaccharide deacetylase family protein [Paraneptunicella aestuarii]|uniref:divergent polysaccharide deacetylase family protein n=1 Tax=Paraneptunicella aestuarii TaxID=2831148 RepID=UPI001E30753C|nr:divergent polysaccharide deacetylase family protein [Paraneptunicella aestuarii]UAA38755.1 divergent polysaccharide deacetylase family protein [Paraneptunicella aestuarii]